MVNLEVSVLVLVGRDPDKGQAFSSPVDRREIVYTGSRNPVSSLPQ